MRSVPPRGWVLEVKSKELPKVIATHPLPRGGTDLMTYGQPKIDSRTRKIAFRRRNLQRLEFVPIAKRHAATGAVNAPTDAAILFVPDIFKIE